MGNGKIARGLIPHCWYVKLSIAAGVANEVSGWESRFKQMKQTDAEVAPCVLRHPSWTVLVP